MLYTYEQAKTFNSIKATKFYYLDPPYSGGRSYTPRFEPASDEFKGNMLYHFSFDDKITEAMLCSFVNAGNINPAYDFMFKQMFSISAKGYHEHDLCGINPNNNPANGGLYITNMSEFKPELKKAYIYCLKQHKLYKQFGDYFDTFWKNAETVNESRKISLLDINKDGTMVKTSTPGYVLFLDDFVLKNKNGVVLDSKRVPYITNLSFIQDCITKNYNKTKDMATQSKDIANASAAQKYNIFLHVIQAMAAKKFGQRINNYFRVDNFDEVRVYNSESDISGGSEDRFTGTEIKRIRTITQKPEYINVALRTQEHSMQGSYSSEKYDESFSERQYPFSMLNDKASFVKLAHELLEF